MEELQHEIDRLKLLYESSVIKHMSDENKMQTLKRIAEEKQIESAAIKFEFREIQEKLITEKGDLSKEKENLSAQNNVLKCFLTR